MYSKTRDVRLTSGIAARKVKYDPALQELWSQLAFRTQPYYIVSQNSDFVRHGAAMALKGSLPRARNKVTDVPENWSAFQAEHNLDAAIIEQLASGHRRSFLKALQPGHKAKLPRWMFVLYQAAAAGYLQGQKSERVGGRVPKSLVLAAMNRSGIQSTSELLEYALSKVALEDDFGKKLLSLKGSIPDDVEF